VHPVLRAAGLIVKSTAHALEALIACGRIIYIMSVERILAAMGVNLYRGDWLVVRYE
jgi:hypothetical protein